jgi:hypothetical protein
MIKPVQLTDKCVFDCGFNPATGNFSINICGQISNVNDYNLPRDGKDLAKFASFRMMASVLTQSSFDDIRDYLTKHPEKCCH